MDLDMNWYEFKPFLQYDEGGGHHYRYGTLPQAMGFVRALNRILHERAPWTGSLMSDDEVFERWPEQHLWKEHGGMRTFEFEPL